MLHQNLPKCHYIIILMIRAYFSYYRFNQKKFFLIVENFLSIENFLIFTSECRKMIRYTLKILQQMLQDF